MRVVLRRFIRTWPKARALLVALALLALPGHLQARPAGESTSEDTHSRYLSEEDRGFDQHGAFLGLATRYTEAVIAGLLTGGLLLNRLVGGSTATMAGSVVGTVIACWLYLGQAQKTYVVRDLR